MVTTAAQTVSKGGQSDPPSVFEVPPIQEDQENIDPPMFLGLSKGSSKVSTPTKCLVVPSQEDPENFDPPNVCWERRGSGVGSKFGNLNLGPLLVLPSTPFPLVVPIHLV